MQNNGKVDCEERELVELDGVEKESCTVGSRVGAAASQSILECVQFCCPAIHNHFPMLRFLRSNLSNHARLVPYRLMLLSIRDKDAVSRALRGDTQ